VRENVGVFDVSHMGEFIVRGADALPFLQKITTNDVSKLEIGQIQYSCMPNLTGGIMDDLLVYRLSEENCSAGERAYMMVVNAGNIAKNWDWVSEQNNHNIHILNISERTGLLAVQGPNATKFLQEMTEIDLSKIKYYNFVKGDFAGMSNVIISATGYTGSGGFEIYVNSDQLPTLWDSMMRLGKHHNLVPCGLGARDTLRLEMGYCLYGNDIDEKTSPIEAGLSWITKLSKGEFNSSEIFAQQKTKGPKRKLMAFTKEIRLGLLLLVQCLQV
jgi:aminomethyltransferase